MALKARSLTVEKTRKFHLWLVISRTQGAKVAARAAARGGRTCGYRTSTVTPVATIDSLAADMGLMRATYLDV